jgi:putative addiction module killer protein
MKMIEIRKYMDPHGRCPFDDWMRSLRDRQGRSRVQVRVDRLALGLQGDWRSVGEGVCELRMPYGPGYRVYYGWDGPRLILLLCAGDKSSQRHDIARAKAYWRDYRGE